MTDAAKDGQQAPDASDSFKDQVQNVPIENLKAPVERVPSPPPKIPEKDAKIAQEGKDQLVAEEKENEDEQQ